MSATTARGAFPYPTGGDNWKQIRAAMQALAEQVGDVTALYAESTAALRPAVGVAGRFHRATDTGALSFDTGTAWITLPLGDYITKGDVASAFTATAETTTSASYTDLATVGPALTVVTGTRALVVIGCNMFNSAVNGISGMSFAVSGATTRAASDDESFQHTSSTAPPGGGAQAEGTSVSLVASLTPGSNTFTPKYYSGGGGTATFRRRRIIVIPL